MEELLAPGGTVEVRDLRARVAAPGGTGDTGTGGAEDEPPLLERGSATLRRSDEAFLAVEGRADTGPGGTVEGTVQIDREGRPTGHLRLDGMRLAAVTGLLPDLPWHRPEETRLTGRLEVGPPQEGTVPLQGEVTAEALGLDSPKLAEEPVTLDLAAEGRGRWTAEGRIEVPEGRLEAGGAEVRLSGAFDPANGSGSGGDGDGEGAGTLVDLDLTLPATPCDRAMGAIPDEILGPFTGFEWSGKDLPFETERPFWRSWPGAGEAGGLAPDGDSA